MGSTVLVEAIRLIVVLAFTTMSFRVARTGALGIPGLSEPETQTFAITAIGTGIGYVVGGGFARAIYAAFRSAEAKLAERHASELLAGALGLLVGLAIAALLAWPILLVNVRTDITYPLAAIIIVSFGAFGARFASRKRLELFGVLGVSPTVGSVSAEGGSLLDTSAAIDGRIVALWRAGLLPTPVWVPSFVIWELQGIADSGDPDRRRRGRRGLEILSTLREAGATVRVIDEDPAGTTEVDGKLVVVARRRNLPIVTSDTNLAKAAELQGLRVVSLHALAEALRPPANAGDRITIRPIKAGRDKDQGIAYLDDGTMVVLEGGLAHLGEETEAVVTSVLQNPTGRMLFASLPEALTDELRSRPPIELRTPPQQEDEDEPPRRDLRRAK